MFDVVVGGANTSFVLKIKHSNLAQSGKNNIDCNEFIIQ